jgi:membrane protein implicated in regulation of membrane protease activity
MNTSSPAFFLIALGVVLILAGLLYWSGLLSWFGRLPGDIRIERETTRIYVPIVSMLVISVVLSLVLWVVGKLNR